jgi:hypothetical protein
MKVFISWSGELSKRVAELLKEWIPNVLQNAEPWMSAADIEKGEIWFGAISDKLAEVRIGIICLTKENVNAPWILFEAGSLSKGLTKNRVCTLLIESEPTDLVPPLSQFNATKPIKEDMAKLIAAINASDKEKTIPEARIQASFERWWPDFEAKFQATKKSPPPSTGPRRTIEDMTVEILETVRIVQKTMQQKEAEAVGQRLPGSTTYADFLSTFSPDSQKEQDARATGLLFALMPFAVKKGIKIIQSVHGGPGNWLTLTVNHMPDETTKTQLVEMAAAHGFELIIKQQA